MLHDNERLGLARSLYPGIFFRPCIGLFDDLPGLLNQAGRLIEAKVIPSGTHEIDLTIALAHPIVIVDPSDLSALPIWRDAYLETSLDGILSTQSRWPILDLEVLTTVEGLIWSMKAAQVPQQGDQTVQLRVMLAWFTRDSNPQRVFTYGMVRNHIRSFAARLGTGRVRIIE